MQKRGARLVARLGAFTIFALSLGPALGEKAKPSVTAAEPPPGFEQMDRARDLLVDVKFNDRVVGRALGRFEAGKLTFKEPAKVAAMIDGLRDRENVEKVLGQPLASNAGRLCAGRPQDDSKAPECGVLVPDVAGIILDEGRLRAEIFVNERYLDPLAISTGKFLERPEPSPSFVARVDAAFAGSGDGRSDVNFRTLAVAAFGEMRLRAAASISSRDGIAPENLTVEMDRPGWFYRAGLYRAISTTIVAESKIYGVGIASSTATRVDIGQAFGSPLTVFLARPAFVDILRDGRIVSTRYYQPGNRALDTSELPDGAYEVTLRIRDLGGGVREETRFFAKTDLLPPPDQPLYYADAGVIAERRSSGLAPPSSVPIGRVGMRRRLAPGLGVGVDVAGTQRDGFAEGSVYYVLPFVQFTASALVTPHSDWGAAGAAIVNYRRWSGSVSARYVRGARPRVEYPDAPRSYRFVNGKALQANASVGYQFRRVRIGATGQFQQSDRPGAKRTYAFGPNFNATLVDNPRHNVIAIGEFLKTDRGFSAYAKIVWRWQAPRSLTITSEAGVRSTRSDVNRETREMGRVVATYQPAPIWGHELILQPSIDRDGPLFFGLQAQGMGPLGRATANVQYGIDGGRSTLAYGATYSGGIAADAKGVGIGGRDPHMSGIVAKVKGPPGSGRYRLFVDGSPALDLKAGDSVPVFLEPYKAHVVELKPGDDNASMTSVGNLRRRVVLYPGTVRTVAWSVEPVTVVFGRAVRADGTPVANARIEGADAAAETDDRGYFQIEVARNRTLVLKADGVPECRLELKSFKSAKGYAGIGTVQCLDRNLAAVSRKQ